MVACCHCWTARWQEAGTIHYETDSDCVYLLVSTPSYPQRTAFQCLDELKQNFRAQYLDAMHKSSDDGLSRTARALLADTCGRFGDASKVDKVLAIQREVNETCEVMHDSVTAMLANRENLEVLEDRAEFIRTEGLALSQHGRRVNRGMQRNRRRIQLMACLLVAITLLIVILPFSISGLQMGRDAYDTMSERIGAFFGGENATAPVLNSTTNDT